MLGMWEASPLDQSQTSLQALNTFHRHNGPLRAAPFPDIYEQTWGGSRFDRLLGQKVAHNQSRSARSVSEQTKTWKRPHVHIVVVSSYGKREAAMDFRMLRVNVGTLQRTTGQHGLLVIVECNLSKLLPVADQMRLDNDLMES